MKQFSALALAICAGVSTALPGCGWWRPEFRFRPPDDLSHYQQMATQIEYPDVETPSDWEAAAALSPLAITEDATPEYWDLTLEETTQMALANAQVLRDLSGVVLRSPGAVRSIHGPAILETDPRFGVEAALAAFDAQFSTSAFFENNDRQINNTFFGGGTRSLQQDLNVYQAQITKRTAGGTLLALRQNTDYDANNAPGNRFPSAWNTNIEAEFRQPLLQGAGSQFNRIAGPGGLPGLPAGVLIARVNTDISLADFEAGVVDFVSNVENAYWDLYFAYRDLHAKIVVRDAALDTWRRTHALYQAGRRGGEADKEAEAREQYYRFQEEVQNAWSGRLLEGTRTNNGSTGGTLRATGGVRVAERRLRLLMGLPISDGRLIRPADEAISPKVLFDWDSVLTEALARRVELRRQKWLIKRREMELVASRNYLLPTLDLVGRHRFRGFGHDFLGEGPGRFSPDFSAAQDLFTGDFQEMQLGVEFTAPFGRRRGHAAVRNAELQVARERSVLREQEREVVHDLSNALADVNRAYEVMQTSLNRRIAAQQQFEGVRALYEAESPQVTLDVVLDAQRRFAEDESRYYAALVEYMLAVKNVHHEKGSLLDYNEIYLSEGPWPGKAYRDAGRRESRRRPPSVLNYILRRPPPVSQGTYPQQMIPAGIDGAPLGSEAHPLSEPAADRPVRRDAQRPPAPGLREPAAANGSDSQGRTACQIGIGTLFAQSGLRMPVKPKAA